VFADAEDWVVWFGVCEEVVEVVVKMARNEASSWRLRLGGGAKNVG